MATICISSRCLTIYNGEPVRKIPPHFIMYSIPTPLIYCPSPPRANSQLHIIYHRCFHHSDRVINDIFKLLIVRFLRFSRNLVRLFLLKSYGTRISSVRLEIGAFSLPFFLVVHCFPALEKLIFILLLTNSAALNSIQQVLILFPIIRWRTRILEKFPKLDTRRNLRVRLSYWDVSINSLDLWNIFYFMVVLVFTSHRSTEFYHSSGGSEGTGENQEKFDRSK